MWKFSLPTMSVGNPAAKRQLPFGLATCHVVVVSSSHQLPG